jgi:hypothetical protein
MAPEYSYMCGLLHSVGQLILFEALPQHYDTLLVESAASGAKLLELERAAFGADHCELSLSLLRRWNLPEEMVDAAAHHHDPHPQSKFTGLVHIASLVADHPGFCISPGSCGPAPDLPPPARQTLEDEPLRVEISPESRISQTRAARLALKLHLAWHREQPQSRERLRVSLAGDESNSC